MSRREKLIEALESTPRDLERMLRPLSAQAALWRPAPDEWCIVDIVAHLGYVEALFLERLRRVVAEERPTVPYIHPDASIHDLGRSLAEQLAVFCECRNAMVAFLQGLEQAQWARHLVRESDGFVSSLRDQVQNLVDHDSAHLAQMVELRRQLERLQ